MRSGTENWVGPVDSATCQMTRPDWIIIVSEATKPGEGGFSR